MQLYGPPAVESATMIHTSYGLQKAHTFNNILHDDALPSTTSMIAEQLRPYRSFKESNRPDLTGPGRKCLRRAVPATRVNWQNPLLWPMIERAAKIVLECRQ
jgi:hypothetical protein